jgi:hypothetical protein
MSIEISSKGVGISIACGPKKEEFVKIDIYGKLEHKDYEVMTPVLERIVKQAKKRGLNVLVDMRDFEGWSARAALDDMKLGLKLRNSFDKMAVVGDKKWEELAVEFASGFTKGKLKFFKNIDKAIKWLNR